MRSMLEGHSCQVYDGSGVIGAIAGRDIADYCGFLRTIAKTFIHTNVRSIVVLYACISSTVSWLSERAVERHTDKGFYRGTLFLFLF